MDPGPPHKRRRPAVACTECRRRKISCDLASPCGQCSKSRFALKCIYNNDRNGNANQGAEWTNPKASEPTKTLEAHPEQPTTLAPMAHSGHYVSIHGSTMFGEGMLNLDTISLDAVTSSHTESNENIFDAIFDFSNRGLDPKHIAIPPLLTGTKFPSLSLMDSPMEMATQSLFPSSTISSSSILAEQLSNLEPDTTKFETQSYNLHIQPEGVRSLLRGLADRTWDSHYKLPPGSESVQSLMSTLAKLERTAIEATESKVAFTTWPHKNLALQANSVWDMLPPRTQCDSLLNAYLKSFESALRILHVPSFLQRYEQFWDRARSQRNDADETFVCTIFVAIAIGSCVSLGPHVLNDSGWALQEQAAGWIAYSRDFLSRKIVTGAHENFEIAQLMCLLTLARHTQAQSGDSAGSRFMFSDDNLARVGIRMRLFHEPVTKGAHGSTKDAEMHRRLWATMLELSLQSCLAEGLPAPIAPDGYDCEPPSNISDEDIEGGVNHQGFTPTTVLGLLAKTQRLRLRVLHLANMPKTPKTSHEAYRIGAELNEACNANMQVLNAMKPQQPIEFQRRLLDMCTRSFVLALHTSFPEPDFTDPASYYSRRMRMEISMLLLYPQASHERPESSSMPNMSVSGPSAPEITGNSMSAFYGTSTNQAATGRPGNTTAPLLATSDAYMSLLIHSNSHGHFVRMYRQMLASLCLDLINELEKNDFPILNQPSLHQIRGVLRVAMQIFESRMRSSSGANSAREFVIFAAAAAYIDALLLGGGATGDPGQTGSVQAQDMDETTARAVLSALNVFTEILQRTKI